MVALKEYQHFEYQKFETQLKEKPWIVEWNQRILPKTMETLWDIWRKEIIIAPTKRFSFFWKLMSVDHAKSEKEKAKPSTVEKVWRYIIYWTEAIY